jgi:hypothetical protein
VAENTGPILRIYLDEFDCGNTLYFRQRIDPNLLLRDAFLTEPKLFFSSAPERPIHHLPDA